HIWLVQPTTHLYIFDFDRRIDIRMNNKGNFDTIHRILSMFPLFFIFAMFLLHLVLPNKTFSKVEQRYLMQLPDFHIVKVLNGSYGARVESSFSDQFPFRNFWINIQNKIE